MSISSSSSSTLSRLARTLDSSASCRRLAEEAWERFGGIKFGSSQRSVAYDLVFAYEIRYEDVAQSMGIGTIGTNHRLIVEYHAVTCTKSSSGGREISKDEKSLAPHFWSFGSNDIDKLAIGGKEGVELRANFILVYFVIEIVDIRVVLG